MSALEPAIAIAFWVKKHGYLDLQLEQARGFQGQLLEWDYGSWILRVLGVNCGDLA